MQIELGFGDGLQRVEVPKRNLLGILTPNSAPAGLRGEAAVARALERPIGTPRLREIVKPGEKVVVVTSDITRPMPTARVMPLLLDELYQAGVQAADISLVFALGSHRRHTQEEIARLAGARAYREIRCVDADAEDCVRMGITARGTPVDVTRIVAAADRRICLGNIEYHYFAGYSGGAKAIMPGVSSRAAIQLNHRHMVDANACVGKLDGNPIREDIEEAAALVGVDFILNVVLGEDKEILCAVAGDPIRAHRAGCAFLDTLYLKRIPRPAEIVLVSAGGFPKDINLYQTQKALENAKHAVRQGGVIILVGSCKEGLGEANFQKWMLAAPNPQSLVERVHNRFELGGHKAAAIAMVLSRAEVYLVSELDDSLVNALFLQPYRHAQTALDAAFEKMGRDAGVLVMPFGGSTLPGIAPPDGGN